MAGAQLLVVVYLAVVDDGEAPIPRMERLGALVGDIDDRQPGLGQDDATFRPRDLAIGTSMTKGILHEGGKQTFQSVQAFGARAVAEAARAIGASLTHVSAIGADENSPAAYARTKAAGEKAVLETVPDAVILRPSIVFVPEDDFFNRFAEMSRFSPFLPLIGGGETKFQPVFVGDVAEAIARTVEGKVEGGRIYELGGPEVMTFRECMEEMLSAIDRKRAFISVPWFAARLQGKLLGLLPNPMLTVDQVEMLKADNVVSEAARSESRTLQAFGIEPRAADAILPGYLWRYRPAGQFTRKGAA